MFQSKLLLFSSNPFCIENWSNTFIGKHVKTFFKTFFSSISLRLTFGATIRSCQSLSTTPSPGPLHPGPSPFSGSTPLHSGSTGATRPPRDPSPSQDPPAAPCPARTPHPASGVLHRDPLHQKLWRWIQAAAAKPDCLRVLWGHATGKIR